MEEYAEKMRKKRAWKRIQDAINDGDEYILDKLSEFEEFS
jgi:hypothetical protein